MFRVIGREVQPFPPQTGAEVRLSQIQDRGACWRCRGRHRTPGLAIATEYLSSVAGRMHHLSRRCPWQALTEKTITSRYSTTSLRWLHDHHCAILIGLARDLGMLLTVMEAGGVASSLGVQQAPRRRRACVVRGVSVSGWKLSQNAFGVKLCLAATASHPRPPPPQARCR